MRPLRLLQATVLATLCLLSPTALADNAARLFQEGKARMAQKDYAAACPMFEQAYRAEQGIGVLLALALCHEQQGRLATALHEFQEVVPLAQRQRRDDREQFARSHVAWLAARVPKLRVVIGDDVARRPGLAIALDGQVLHGIAGPIELDPGSHTFEATAPGMDPIRRTVVLEASQETTVEVGAPGQVAPHPSTPIRRETVGLVLGGVGAVAVLVGTTFGIRALNAEADARRRCSTPSACEDLSALSSSKDAKSFARISNVSFGVAIVALASGAVLYFGGRRSPASATAPVGSSLSLVPSITTGGMGLAFEGTTP